MMTPREFCRQGLAVLRLPDGGGADRVPAPLETLLSSFTADDVRPEVFELQLQLLAVSELCPDISAAAARILHVWRVQQAGRPTLVCTDHRN
jgi:hypothetical protein